MNETTAFGGWLKRRRRALDMTQDDLARRAGCSVESLRKIEAGVFRPSKQLAELLAACLEVAPEDREAFVHFARAAMPVEQSKGRVQPAGSMPGRAQSRVTNLQAQPTPFIGREKEVASVPALLRREEVRMLTLVGPPGIGKTRLALKVAADLLDDFGDGVFFVALSPISDPSLVASTVAQTLGVRETSGRPLPDALKVYLRGKQLLLVLDNFEQVVDAAPLVAELSADCPGLKVLVTSRTSLRVYGEYEFPVPPLEMPDPNSLPSIERLTQYEAIRLFTERALAVKPDFEVTAENASSVAQICSRLDGLPLAIELAAARVRVLPPQALVSKLSNSLDLLTGGALNLPPRQQTLRTAIASSYELLDEAEQALFRRLSVFVGGCVLEAVEAVASYELRVASDEASNSQLVTRNSQLVTLESLVDKSLVRQSEVHGEARFWMLETIHEYAAEKLAESGEALLVRQCHSEFFLRLAEQAEVELLGADQPVWLDRLEREHDNLRAAMSFSLEQGDAATAARLGGALRRFWYLHAHMAEGRRWLERALTNGTALPLNLRAKALHGIGSLAWSQGDYASAWQLFEEGLEIFRELGDRHGEANMLHNLGIVALPQGDYGEAYALHEEALQIFRELGHKWSIALSLANLGMVDLHTGNYDRAYDLLSESLALRRELGEEQSIAQSLNNLGTVLRYKGDCDGAYELHRESLEIFRALGDTWSIALCIANMGLAETSRGNHDAAGALLKESLAMFRELGVKQGIATCLEGLTGVAAQFGQAERAARLLGATDALRESIGAPISPHERAEYERNVLAARSELGEEAFAKALAAGRVMPLERAIASALEE